MDYLLIGSVSVVVAALTLFSGFGLGTLLLPAFAIFFPIEIAVAATAVVHLANDAFKVAIVGRNCHWPTLWRFGIPAVLGAFAGAWALRELVASPTLATYTLAGGAHTITTIGLVVGTLIVVFAVIDMAPSKKKGDLDPRWLSAGGGLSGFFGGLSGHQGALRSAFLIRAGLSRDGFIATAAVASVLVDVSRLTVYGFSGTVLTDDHGRSAWPLVATACACAFTGSYVGAKLVKKTRLERVRLIVGVMLLLAGAAIASGLI